MTSTTVTASPPTQTPFVSSASCRDRSNAWVTFELTAECDNVGLAVTYRRLPNRAEMLSVAGDWHAHLGILLDRINGRTPPNFWKAHARPKGEYKERLTHA